MMDKDKGEKRLWSALMIVGIAVLGMLPEAACAKETVSVVEITGQKEAAQLVSDTWEEDYFGKIVVDPDSGKLEKDGEKETFSKEFEISPKEAGDILESERKVENFLQEDRPDTVYEVETNKDGDIEIAAPYQTKRLIVLKPSLEDTFGASKVYRNKNDGETILQFKTEEAAKKAYEEITARYGKDTCYVDEILYFGDMMTSFGATDTGSGDSSCYSWGAGYMQMNTLKSKAESMGYKNTVTVAVIDSGIDTSNSIFSGNRVSGKSYSFFDGNRDLTDYFGHGTHVSGIIADATPDNVKIMMLKVTNKEGRSSLYTMRTALNYAISQKAAVINMSMGVIGPEAEGCTFLNDSMKKAYYRGIPFCVSAGNQVKGFPNLNVKYCYPANTTWPITVSALDTSEGDLAYYSYRGSTVDFAAPGSSILSAKSKDSKVSEYDRENHTRTYMWGTSMAAPHITAAVAYLKMIEPKLSVAGVTKELKKRSIDLGKAGKDTSYGWGCPKMAGLFDKKLTYGYDTVKAFKGKTSITKAENTKSGVRLSWKKTATANTYRVYRKVSGGSYQYIGKTSASRRYFIDRKAAQGKKYCYSVQPYRYGEKGLMSAGKTIVALKKVTKVNVSYNKGSSLRLTWNKQKKVSGYQVQYSLYKNMKKSRKVFIRKNRASATLKKLRKKTYYYRVRAWRTSGGKNYYSAWTSMKKIRVK